MKRTGSNMTDYVSVRDGRIETGLSLFRYEESGNRIVYSPALNVIGYGRTFEEAESDFNFCLGEFFRSTLANGSFEPELMRLGWRKNVGRMTSPSLQEMLPGREVFCDIFNNRSYKKVNRSLSFSFA